MRRILVVVALVAGCASVGGLKKAPLTDGEYRIYKATLDETRRAAYNALTGSGLRMDETDQVADDTWMLIAIRETGEWTAGEIVRIVVRAEDAEHSRVTVLSRRRVAMNITAKGNYADEMFDQITFQLGDPVNVPSDGCIIDGAWKAADEDCPA